MDRKEVYLWGTLFALVREQLDALERLQAQKLGFWGRARFRARTRKINQFLHAIVLHKLKAGHDPVVSMGRDVAFITYDRAIWDDIRKPELEYVRTMLDHLS